MGKLMKSSNLLLTNGKSQYCFRDYEIIMELLEVDQLFSILNVINMLILFSMLNSQSDETFCRLG